MKIQVSMAVQYFALRTMNPNGKRLDEPERVGPLPAVVHKVKDADVLDVVVFANNGRPYLATNVTREPTTRIEHYWRPIPEE